MYAIFKMQCTIVHVVHVILHMYVENVRIIYKAMVVAAILAVRQFIAKLYFCGKRGGGTEVTGQAIFLTYGTRTKRCKFLSQYLQPVKPSFKQ
jgi:hypothetical protein